MVAFDMSFFEKSKIICHLLVFILSMDGDTRPGTKKISTKYRRIDIFLFADVIEFFFCEKKN